MQLSIRRVQSKYLLHFEMDLTRINVAQVTFLLACMVYVGTAINFHGENDSDDASIDYFLRINTNKTSGKRNVTGNQKQKAYKSQVTGLSGNTTAAPTQEEVLSKMSDQLLAMQSNISDIHNKLAEHDQFTQQLVSVMGGLANQSVFAIAPGLEMINNQNNELNQTTSTTMGIVVQIKEMVNSIGGMLSYMLGR